MQNIIRKSLSFKILALTLSLSPLAIFELEAATRASEKSMALAFPDSNSEVVGIIEENQEVQVLQKSGDWSLIEFRLGKETKKGWLKSSQVRTERAQNSISESNDEDYLRSSDPANNFLFPTALSNRQGSKLIKGAGLGIWSFDYSITDSTTVGARTVLPIGFVGIGPRIKQTFSVNENFHFGVSGEAGGLASLWDYEGSSTLIYYVAGAMATLGNAERAITFGSYVIGGGFWDETTSFYSDDTEFVHGGIVMLNANAFYRVNKYFKVMVDAMLPATFYDTDSLDGFEWGTITYGARIGGELVSGDVGFTIPIADGMGETMKRMPLGIPYLSLNFAF